MRRHAGLGLVGLLMLGACAQPAQLFVRPTDARVTLNLSGAFARRALAITTPPSHWKISIDGPDLTAASTQTAAAASGTTLVTLQEVPVGDRRVIDLQALDASGTALPGAEVAIVGAIHTGANSLAVSPATTATARVYAQMLADDRARGSRIAAALDLATLDATVQGYARALKTDDFGLLDAAAIAKALEAGGAPPSAAPGFLDAAGTVLVQPADWPDGQGYTVSIDDPTSWPVHSDGPAPVFVSPVRPGSWTLTVTPDAHGLAPITQAITVTAGQTTQVPLSLGASQQDAALPFALAPAVGAMLTVNGQQGYVAIGGIGYDGTTPESATNQPGVPFVSVLTDTAAQGWKAGSQTFSQPILDAAATVDNGIFYWFGGLDANYNLQSSAYDYDPSTMATPAPLPTLPGGVALQSAAAATVDGQIYVTGGVTEASGTPNVATFAFDPAQQTWLTQAPPGVSPSRADMASAVVGSDWYLFGGQALQGLYVNGGSVPQSLDAPRSDVSILSGGKWHVGAAMPTARSGAATLVLNGLIYVIGGAGELGLPSRAVEVYDPAKDSWSVRPPLRVGRSHAMVFYQGGKIVVAGGLAGAEPATDLALDTVEELTP